ncbi:MAG: TcmI family type II polyketide cyclase [Streptomycetaceae bacterium]|nr:TcmI family type II polyketide cyclase [Streptomycetaceae bacterium]
MDLDTTLRNATDRPIHDAPDDASDTAASGREAKLRVLLMLEIHDGSQERFLAAYESIRDQVARVPGHLHDQLCQSIDDPTQWLITSEWDSADTFLAWVDSPEHQLMVQPLHGCVRGTRSLRYAITRETGASDRVAAAPVRRPATAASPNGTPPVIRTALSFTVKPGSEDEVAAILAGYESPDPHVDDTTSLRRTSVFMHGNRVVRAIEIEGDMRAALQHVARQPQVRAAEEALNEHLEEARDLDDPEAARAFFMRASLAQDFQMTSPHPRPGDDSAVRVAFRYPVRHGAADHAARLLARHDAALLEDPEGPLAASVVYVRQDILVRVVDLRVAAADNPAVALGVAPDTADRLGRLLDIGDDGTGLTDDAVLRRLFELSAMRPVTDRRAQDAS